MEKFFVWQYDNRAVIGTVSAVIGAILMTAGVVLSVKADDRTHRLFTSK